MNCESGRDARHVGVGNGPNLGWMFRVEQYTIAPSVDVTPLVAPDSALGVALARRR